MSTQLISGLPSATAGPTDRVVVNQDGVTSTVEAAALAALAGPTPLLASDTDVDFTTAGPGKVLAAVPSGGKPYSFITPASGSSGGGSSGGGSSTGAMPTLKESHVAVGGAGPAAFTWNEPLTEGEVVVLYCGYFGTTLTEPTDYATLGAPFGAYERGIVYYLVAVGGETGVSIANAGGGSYGIVALVFDGATAPSLENFGSNGSNVSPAIVANAANGIVLAGFTAYSGQFSAAAAGHTLIAALQAYDGGNGAVDVQTAPTVSGTSYSVTQDADSINAAMTLILYPIAASGGPSSTLASDTDVDFTTAAAGRVLAFVPSGGKPYSFIPPASGGSGGGGGGTVASLNAVQLAEATLSHLWQCNDAPGATTLADSKGTTPLAVGSAVLVGVAGLLNDGLSAVFLPGNESPNSLLSALALPASGPLCVEFLYALLNLSGQVGIIANLGGSGTAASVTFNVRGAGAQYELAPGGTDSTFLGPLPSGATLAHLELDGAGTAVLSLNGVVVYSGTGFATALSPAMLYLGIYGPNSPSYSPTFVVQNVAVYTAMLSQAQKTAHMNAVFRR